MIVLDASAALRLFLPFEDGHDFGQRLVDLGEGDIHVPSHFKIELLSALRGFKLKGAISHVELIHKSLQVREFSVVSHRVDDFIPRIIDLTHNSTPYDAAYVALAEALDCPLITGDRRIADIPGIQAKVVIV